MLFKKLAGFEDYYSLIEALGAAKVGHVFYCECGFACAEVIRGGAGRLADSMAEAVARTICELFRVNAPVSLLPQKAPFSHAVVAVYPVYLKEGFFNLRSGPGAAHHVIRVIEGLIYSGFYARESGWLLLSGEGGEYLSEAAVDMYLNPQATGASPQPGGYEKETTGRDGFYFVLNQPRAGAEILGAVGTGVTFLTAYHRGYRLVNYCDRAGFIGPSAWR
jgi:hypothetical protein